MSKQKEPQSAQHDIGGFTMLRDVLIASMNKGQFPLALAALIIISLIFKMPEKDVSLLVFSILEKLQQGAYIAYALAFLTLGGWFFHARYQRRIVASEIDRLCDERTQLQQKHLGLNVKSSSRSEK